MKNEMKKKYSKTEESGCHWEVVGQGFPARDHFIYGCCVLY